MEGAFTPYKPLAGARAAIERARALARGRDDYALIHARVLAELGEFASARQILGPLMTAAYPDHVRDTARRWMNTIVQMEENRRKRDESAARAASRSEEPPSDE